MCDWLMDQCSERLCDNPEFVMDLLTGEIQLRSKKELIERFILENLPNISDTNDIPTAFEEFWNTERRQAFADLCKIPAPIVSHLSWIDHIIRPFLSIRFLIVLMVGRTKNRLLASY